MGNFIINLFNYSIFEQCSTIQRNCNKSLSTSLRSIGSLNIILTALFCTQVSLHTLHERINHCVAHTASHKNNEVLASANVGVAPGQTLCITLVESPTLTYLLTQMMHQHYSSVCSQHLYKKITITNHHMPCIVEVSLVDIVTAKVFDK